MVEKNALHSQTSKSTCREFQRLEQSTKLSIIKPCSQQHVIVTDRDRKYSTVPWIHQGRKQINYWMAKVAASNGILLFQIQQRRVMRGILLLPFIKRSAAKISLKGPVPSPIIYCSFYCGPSLQDLHVCEFVLHNSYWTWLENMDYSLNILLHLPEREHQESIWTGNCGNT